MVAGLTTLLAIDPASDEPRTGWATFDHIGLTACGLWTEPPSLMPFEMVIEFPRWRPNTPNAQDLLEVAYMAGRIAGDRARPWNVRRVFPDTWKGQVSKTIHHERIFEKLSEIELATYRRCTAPLPASLRHNTTDAVGLGLWAIGRLRR